MNAHRQRDGSIVIINHAKNTLMDDSISLFFSFFSDSSLAMHSSAVIVGNLTYICEFMFGLRINC